MGTYNWTDPTGVGPRPYATAVKYYCPRSDWGYPSTGESETVIYCLKDGTWSNSFDIEPCMSEYTDVILKICHVKTYQNYPVLSNHQMPYLEKVLSVTTILS